MLVAHAIRNIFSKAILQCTTFRYRRVYALQMHSSLEKRLGAAHGTWMGHKSCSCPPDVVGYTISASTFNIYTPAPGWNMNEICQALRTDTDILDLELKPHNSTKLALIAVCVCVCGFCTAGISQKSRWHLGWVQSTMNLSSFLIFPARRCSKYSSKTWQFLLRNDTGYTNDLVRKNLILPSWRIINIKEVYTAFSQRTVVLGWCLVCHPSLAKCY